MATRFRLPSSGSPPVTPTVGGSYTHSGSEQKRPISTSNSSTLTSTGIAPDGADHLVAGDTLHYVGVSDPLAAQTISAQTVTLAIQAIEDNAGNNLFVQMAIYV